MALASDRPTLGKWKWKFPQLAEISDSGRTCATLLLEYFRYWFYNVNRRGLIGSSWGRWNFATIEVKCSLSLRMETCFERWWWEIVNWVVSEAERSDLWVKKSDNPNSRSQLLLEAFEILNIYSASTFATRPYQALTIKIPTRQTMIVIKLSSSLS